MTKAELIAALQATSSPDDAVVILWVEGSRRTVVAASADTATGEPHPTLTLKVGFDQTPR